MATYFIGKGYGISNITDVSGRPLLTFQGPEDKKPFLLSDRVAQTFDFTVPQVLKAGAMKNSRLDSSTSSYIKDALGGVADDELDHKISLELGGSNTPANLMLQPGRGEGASAASDTLENSLALEVVAGRMSLLTAWRTLAEQKGFLLGEDSKIGTSFSISEIASNMFNIAVNMRGGIKKTQLSEQARALQAQMKDDIEKLKQNPLNQKLQAKIFSNNVANAKEVLSVTGTEAAGVTKSFIGAYANEKGIDPREMIGALNTNIQQIINNSKESPNVFGIPTPVIIKVIGVLQSVSTVAVTGGIILAIVGIFLAGPEAILGAISGGLLESIGAIFGVSTTVGIGLTSFAFGEAMTVASIGMGMTIKQTYDNVYLLPTQQISSLKEALAVQKGLASFLPSEVKSLDTGAPKGGGGGFSGSSVSGTSVHISVVSGGALGAVTTFTPADRDIFENITELQHAAEQNLARYLGGIFGQLVYHLKLVGTVRLNDGTVRVGTTQLVQHGVTKKGRPTYKKVTNKFVVADINYKTLAGVWKKLDEIVIGAVDEKGFHPAAQDLAGLSTAISSYLVANHLGGVTQINLPSPASGQPTQTAPAQMTAPTTTPPPTSPPPAGSVMSAPVAATVPAPIVSPYVPQPVAPAPSPPAADYPGLTEAEAAIANGDGITPDRWRQSPGIITSTWKKNIDDRLAKAAVVAAAAPPPQAISPLPAGMRSANGYIYNLRTSGGTYSGPLDSAPAAAMGLLYQQLGLGSLSMYVGSAQQIAAIDARLPKS